MLYSGFLKKIIPSKYIQAYEFYKIYQSNRNLDIELRKKYGTPLEESFTKDLKIVQTRDELLKYLPKNGYVAEVGVAFGNYSTIINKVCTPKELHLIDLWDPSNKRYADGFAEVNSKFEQEIKNNQVIIKQGYSWDIIETYPDHYFDFVYLDSSHDFDSVNKELAAVTNKIKKNGFICGHDYSRWAGSGVYRWGVVEAVNNFCRKNNWELIYITNEPNRLLSYAIKKL